ncbi:MAG: cation diffusion facilitator family transporter [Dehalococcoidia bacterium]
MHAHPNQVRKALIAGLCLTLAFVVIEAVAGFLTNSLALVSDAGHMLADSAGLILALGAATLARRPAGGRHTYGHARFEVLVVPIHVVLLGLIAGYIAVQSIGHLRNTPDIETGPVIAVGLAGLAVNLLVVRLLHNPESGNLNLRAASLEASVDAIGSVAVVVSAIIIAAGGWAGTDAIVGLAIAAMVVPRAWSLLKQSADILLESAPSGVDPVSVESAAMDVEGVIALHDVHVWSIAPDFPALSAHVELADVTCTEHILTDLATLFRERFGIGHVTLQPETPALHEAMECCLSPDAGLLEPESHSHGPVAVQ